MRRGRLAARDNAVVRTRLALLTAALCLSLTAPAPAGPVVTVAVGSELGYGPGSRLKGWRDEVGGRLCLRVFIPYAIDGRRTAHRWVDCVPYPARRALTHRVAGDPCGSGMSLLYGLARADVARVEHTIGTYEQQPNSRDMRLFRVARLTGADAVVVGYPAEDNVIRLYDAAGTELKRLAWYAPFPLCPSRPVRFL
jgi:hypothetical protein